MAMLAVATAVSAVHIVLPAFVIMHSLPLVCYLWF